VDRVELMAQRADEGDVDGLTELLLNEQPDGVRDRRVVQMWARAQAQRLVTSPLREVIRRVPAAHPVEERAALKEVACPVLLIGQEGDEAHPSSVVHELAEALPDARVEIFSAGGVLWNHRGEVRQLISGFLND
jgi:pimeloyl-ACP methyl ester carboxylesterase